MKCPGCGAEIPEGHLLCDVCGQEIRIVPDFEPEVENSITESLSDVIEALAENDLAEKPEEKRERGKNMFVLALGGVFLFLLALLIAGYSVSSYHHSPEYQLKTAMAGISEEDYESALVHLQNALDAGGDFEDIKLQMASCYQALGDEDAYVEGLFELIGYEQVSDETLENAYMQLIAFYDEKKQYEQINILLQSCPENVIREKYAQYMADMPEFNYKEGSYNSVIPLKILSNTSGHIYYTMDGSNPDSGSEEYLSPIFLETGDYEVTAVFVNDYGIQSPYAKAVYHVDVSAPFAPEIDAYSGDFTVPQMIHAEAEEGCRIYYTTDGSEPDALSSLYNGFLPMPLGDSSFKFAAIDENGVSSEVTVRHYHLEPDTGYSWEDARTVVLKYMLETGSVVDLYGTISAEDLRRLTYTFACCVPIEGDGDFYIFSEYIENPDGSREKTGNYYAVGIYDLTLYGTQYDVKSGNFALSTALLRQG